MKTVEEFYKEISDTKALQDELKNVSEEMLGAFLKKHECEASAEEFVEFLKAQSEGAIEDEDVLTVAGGSPMFEPYWQTKSVQTVI